MLNFCHLVTMHFQQIEKEICGLRLTVLWETSNDRLDVGAMNFGQKNWSELSSEQ